MGTGVTGAGSGTTAAAAAAAATAAGVTVEAYGSVDDLAPADLAAATAIFNAAWAGWVPGDRAVDADAFADRERKGFAPHVAHHVLARDAAGGLVALGVLEWRDDEGEPGACVARIQVAPEAREHGVGGAVGAHLVDLARAAHRIGVSFDPAVDSPADEACRRAGLREDLVIELNRARVDAAPDALLDGWIAAGEAAPGYSLVGHDGRCPEDLVAGFTHAWAVMNDAPRYEGEPAAEFSVAEHRAAEVAFAAARLGWWALGVRHDATGELVGLSELFLPAGRPWMGYQGDTGVAAGHRGHGLGAWMKAVNHRRLRVERPDVELLSTWNASANAPMLRINRALGYQPAQRFRAWYLPFS